MNYIEITINDKTYTCDYISVSKYKEMLKVRDKINVDHTTSDDVDLMCEEMAIALGIDVEILCNAEISQLSSAHANIDAVLMNKIQTAVNEVAENFKNGN